MRPVEILADLADSLGQPSEELLVHVVPRFYPDAPGRALLQRAGSSLSMKMRAVPQGGHDDGNAVDDCNRRTLPPTPRWCGRCLVGRRSPPARAARLAPWHIKGSSWSPNPPGANGV